LGVLTHLRLFFSIQRTEDSKLDNYDETWDELYFLRGVVTYKFLLTERQSVDYNGNKGSEYHDTHIKNPCRKEK
jgi:hypothetical protein